MPNKLEEIAKTVADFVQHPRCVLFAGAGVGNRIGLPTWAEWMEQLATVCERFEENTAAALIRERLSKGNYLSAATVYTSTDIPINERLRQQAEPFKVKTNWSLENLEAILRLPFSGIVTTNYDRSLHNGYSKFYKTSALPLELGEPTMRNAATITDYFIARIHGREELPQSMVFDTAGYAKLEADKDYLDFLTTILKLRPCLFVGFSFSDPGITSVINFYKENFGPNFPTLHLALVPLSEANRLGASLGAVGIRVLCYDDQDNHKDLWRLFRESLNLNENIQLSLNLSAIVPKELALKEMHRVVAFAYARSKAPEAAARPALEMVQDGVLLSILDDEPSSHLEKEVAIQRIRELLRLDIKTATSFFASSLLRLKASGEISDTNRYISRRSEPSQILSQSLRKLTTGVEKRFRILKGKRIEKSAFPLIDRLWEELFIVRAWDLGAQYAGSIVSKGLSISNCVEDLAAMTFRDNSTFAGEISEMCLDLIHRPDRGEAEALAEISHTAITVNILFSSTRSALSHPYTLPTRLYFDANILLPAIAEGHPMHKGYDAAIKKLQDAASRSGLKCELVVATEFLEEILAHRQNAIDLVRELNLEDPEALYKHIVFYGAENTNVFVGAFSSLYSSDYESRHSFKNFLKETAPYQGELELIAYLGRLGIKVERMTFHHQNNVEYTHIFNNLIAGYERYPSGGKKKKDTLLIQHEARQLTKLFLDLSAGGRSVFVTADTRLQKIIQGDTELEKLSGNVLSELGFIGLVDLLVGLPPDQEIFTRLVWATPRSNAQQQVRDYLVALTLRRYEDAMAKSLPEVLQNTMNFANTDFALDKLQFGDASTASEAKRASVVLDRLEDNFFEMMARAIDSHS